MAVSAGNLVATHPYFENNRKASGRDLRQAFQRSPQSDGFLH